MILDAQQILADAQEVLSTAASENVLDMGAATYGVRSPVGGADEYLVARVETAFADGTSIQVVVQTDNDVAFGSVDKSWTFPAVVTANATAGALLAKLSLKGLTLSRYLRSNFVVVGTHTAGKIDCYIVNEADHNNK